MCMRSCIARVAIWRTASRNTTVPVCRPHQLFADARQSVAAVFLLVRICADAGLAASGIERHTVRQSAMLDATGETFENCCTGGYHHPPGVVFMV